MAGTATRKQAAIPIPLTSTALAFAGFCRIPEGDANKGIFQTLGTTNWCGVSEVGLNDVELALLINPEGEDIVPKAIRQEAGHQAGQTYFPTSGGREGQTPATGLSAANLVFTGYNRVPRGQETKGMYAKIKPPGGKLPLWLGMVDVTLGDDEIATQLVPITDEAVPPEIKQAAGRAPAETYFAAAS